MDRSIKSEGKCPFCDKTFTKGGINRHMVKHLTEKSVHGQKGISYLLKVETDRRWGSSPYFLSLWVDGKTQMSEIDGFLRDIWLECCGHLSAFKVPRKWNEYEPFDFMEAEELLSKGKTEEYEELMEKSMGEIPMRRISEEVFYKGLKFRYEYDFGSTTALEITVLEEYPIAVQDEITLLSRNEPLPILCESCGKLPATEICTVCYGYTYEGLFCKKCAVKHAVTCEDFDDYSRYPVVNSPRMGVCGYEGGTIDKERDSL